MQSAINPDDIFGAVKPIQMEGMRMCILCVVNKVNLNVIHQTWEAGRTIHYRVLEIFVNRKTRPRTSSAHWDGADSLASSEVAQYNHSMGYHQTLPPSSRSNNSADGR